MKGNKSKKTLLVLIAIVIFFMLKVEVFAAEKSGTAQTTTKNGGTISWSFTVNDDTKQITNLKCTNPEGISGEIEVPSIIEVEGVEYTVVSLSSNAFEEAKSITKVTIPDTILSMKDLSTLGNGCFYNCSSLTEVVLGKISNINARCFENCTSLKRITIPDSVTRIGEEAFSGCVALEEITIPNTINVLNSKTFYKCISLKSINIPSSVTKISSYCFEDCTSLTEVTIPDSVNLLERGVFRDCTNLKKITISKNVQELPSYAFAYCTSLTEVVIPESVVSIQSDSFAEGAFSYCESLQKVTIPDTVTFIGKYAFYNCGKGKLGLFVEQGSYAETWAKTNGVTYSYGDGTSQSGNEAQGQIPSEAKEYNGHKYYIYEEKITWEEAKAFCESKGGYLVTITSEGEQQFIKQYIEEKNYSKQRFWIGATDAESEGIWKWVTGEKFSYSNWGGKEPDNLNDQDYAMIQNYAISTYEIEPYEWDDIKSSDKIYFICEWGEYIRDEEKNEGKDETVTSATKIPQTGEKYGMFIVAGIVVLAGAIGIIRYKKYKGI